MPHPSLRLSAWEMDIESCRNKLSPSTPHKNFLNEDDMMVIKLIIDAFTQASIGQQGMSQRWIKASNRITSLLPTSDLVGSVQSVGHMDILIRAMEDEAADPKNLQLGDTTLALALTYQRLFSELWVGSTYEIARLLRERDLAPSTSDFKSLMCDLMLLRIPLEKHEIANDRKLNAPLVMRRIPEQAGDMDVIYDNSDKGRAHILPKGMSARGSNMWFVFDVRAQAERWLERRALSDLFLGIFAGDETA